MNPLFENPVFLLIFTAAVVIITLLCFFCAKRFRPWWFNHDRYNTNVRQSVKEAKRCFGLYRHYKRASNAVGYEMQEPDLHDPVPLSEKLERAKKQDEVAEEFKDKYRAELKNLRSLKKRRK